MNNLASVRYFILAVVTGCAVLFGDLLGASADTIIDPLTGTSINPQLWQFGVWPDNLGVSLTPSSQGVQVAFATDAHNTNGNGPNYGFGANLVGTKPVTGDFNVQVDYSLLQWPATNGVRVGLGLAGSDGTGATLQRNSLGTAGDLPGYPRENYTFAVQPPGQLTALGASDLTGTLRLSRVQGEVTAFVGSSAGWIPLGSFQSNDEFIYDFAAWSESPGIDFTNQPVTVAFTNFSATGVVPEPTTLALLGVGAMGLAAYAWRWRRPIG